MIKEHNDLLFVGLPEGITDLIIHSYPRSGIWLMERNGKTLNSWKVKLPPGDWELIGIHPGLTEDQAKKVVKYTGTFFDQYKYYGNNPLISFCGTALESLSTLMDHLKLYTVNPYGDPAKPQPYCRDCADENGRCPNRNEAFCDKSSAIKQYQEAQSRTFPLWAVLKRITDGNK